jgi:hypothetical protein
MNFSYRLHSLVHQDLEEGYRWYEDREEGLGERFLSAWKIKYRIS